MVETFGAAGHDEVLQLVFQIALLLTAARLMGGLAQRLGQPGIVGEILAGVLLGPSLISGLFPRVGEWILPRTPTQGQMLEVVSLIGVMLLLIITGFETDLALIRRQVRVASGVAMGGLVVPFASGVALGFLIPEDLLSDPSRRTVFALFLATALSISAIPVLAKVLMELGLMRRQLGQTMLAAGMIDDITGWALLGLVTALAGADSLGVTTLAVTIARVLVFILVSITVGRLLVDRSLRLVQDRLHGQDSVLTLVIVLAFAWGAVTQTLHLEPVLGAFVIGILFGRLPRLPVDVVHKIESMALSIFAPIFFAVAGLKVDFLSILEPRLLAITGAVILVATMGKVVGVYAGARVFAGQDHWSSLAYGSGLNARGAIGIIIATIGLSLDIISSTMFSIVIIMAVVTSLMAPVALRFCIGRIQPEIEEIQRIQKEEALRNSFTSGIKRLLVPVRPRSEPAATQTIEALISRRLATTHGTATMLFAATEPSQRDLATDYLTRLVEVFRHGATSWKVAAGDEPAAEILREAAGGYDLVMLGAPTMAPTEENVFGPVIDDLVRMAPCPTVVVRTENLPTVWEPLKILVPSDGSATSRRALDLALAIAGPETEVRAVHVVTPSLSGLRTSLAEDITAEIEVVSNRLDRVVETTIVEAEDVGSGILQILGSSGADLLVMGTGVRAGTARLHLGPRVEFIARRAPCPVVILNT